ncbi:unnamed protein product [Zymoseptoria tritici ST99CH_3D1]|nr:unnamed protein product [Zymoseptoria tritici ST99CH_3D1]
MRPTTSAIDPLWQCLCPSWTQSSIPRASRALSRPRRTPQPCPAKTQRALLSSTSRRRNQSHHEPASTLYDNLFRPQGTSSFRPFGEPPAPASLPAPAPVPPSSYSKAPAFQPVRERTKANASSATLPSNLHLEETNVIYTRLQAFATDGQYEETRQVAEYLVRTRREQPNLQLYRALILSNIDSKKGAAWRVSEYLDEMAAEGLQMDVGICHAVLKVVAVHLDHLLREDVLDYMKKRWYNLTVDGAHDVAAGYFREGRFEQALLQMGKMRKDGMPIDRWLWDMSLFTLCDAGEIEEAYRTVRTRWDSPHETRIGTGVWWFLLDKASEARHYDGTSLAWQTHVKPGYMNPSSGMCLNVLATAAHAGDAALATEVFSHLSKRGTAFQPIHYELLISAYLAADPPDVTRALSILTIMPLEKLEPTLAETRSLFSYLKDKPALVGQLFNHLRSLHAQNRKIPIAVLNLLIECYVEQRNLQEALKIYKVIHTFAPMEQGAQKSYANIETFNMLFKACRTTSPPDEKQASFLVSELLALRIVPTALTYDRLILVFVEAAKHALESVPASTSAAVDDDIFAARAATSAAQDRGKELLDWAFRHFLDMQPLGWMPRFGTLELLAVQLAKVGDERCWDVLQLAGDKGSEVEGWQKKGKLARANVERAWEKATAEDEHVAQGSLTG